jgi:hypothetical protein
MQMRVVTPLIANLHLCPLNTGLVALLSWWGEGRGVLQWGNTAEGYALGVTKAAPLLSSLYDARYQLLFWFCLGKPKGLPTLGVPLFWL